MILLPGFLKRRKRLLAPLRALHYQIWRKSGFSGLSPIWPELGVLRRIVSRSSEAELTMSEGGPRILIFTIRNWNTHVIYDALIGHALRRRGASVEFLSCGGPLPICEISPHTIAPPMPCHVCAPYITEVLSMLKLPFHQVHELTTAAERDEIRRRVMALDADVLENCEFEDLVLGELVRPSVQWFLLSGSPRFDREMEDVYRRFLISGATMARATARLLDRSKPDKIYLLNGIFAIERIAIELARRRDIPFVTHEGGFLPDSQVFSSNGFAPHHQLDSVWPSYAEKPLVQEEAFRLDTYLAQRERGQRDVSRYYPSIERDQDTLVRRLDLDRERPIVSLFTNVDWDTACFAARAAFDHMEHWLSHVLSVLSSRPEWQLVVRIHPAEVRLPFLEPRENAMTMITRHLPSLPSNVRVVPPESDLSTYALMDISRAALVYTSTTGLEMILRGKPAVVAGRSYYSGKGFSYDARSVEEFDELLEHAVRNPRIPEETVERARRYACLFFFRHQIPFPLTTTKNGRVHFNFQNLEKLRPGLEPDLDLVCDGILKGHPFLRIGEI